MLDRLSSFFSVFLSWWGLLALSFIDSSVFFFTPLANDLVVILLTAREPDRFWLYPAIATAGSLGGIALTYFIGRKLGEPGLSRFVSENVLESAKSQVNEKGAFAVGAMAIVPPPFPLTPLVLVAGAFEVSATRLLATAGIVRAVRFGVEAVLARTYGERITGWLESTAFTWIVGILIVAAVVGSGYGIFRAIRHGRRDAGMSATRERPASGA